MVEVKSGLIVERIREDMAKTKRYGTETGRPPREIPGSFKKYYPMWKVGDITATDFARLIVVSRPTIYKHGCE